MSTEVEGPAAAAEHLATTLLGELPTALGGLQVDHARRVAAAVRGRGDEATTAAAFLHDVVETGCIAEDELDLVVSDPRVVDLVRILTRRDGEDEHTYLERCCTTPEALLIKRADLADKLTADDWTVAPAVADVLRRRAVRRLALLDALAGAATAAS
jgi:hypothetical protein